MVDKVINAVRNGESCVQFAGDGRVKRQYVYVDDLANCIVKHVKLDTDANYNFASEEELSAEDMMQSLLKAKKINLQYEFKNTMVAGQFVRTVAVDKVKKLFPDLEFTPFSEGVARVYDKWSAEEQI
jgi:nucleoside-diphosphate-sugar epimerase